MDPITLGILVGIASTVGATAIIAMAQRMPEIMVALKRVFAGLNFLVVGHKGAGKTSFYNYLQFDKFADTYPVNSTETESKKMSFDVNKGGNLHLRIKSAFDIPGEWRPADQVEKIIEKRPKVLIVFTSYDFKESSEFPTLEAWLESFFVTLRDALRNDKNLAKRLRALIVVFNKIDQIKKPGEVDKRISSMEKIIVDIIEPVMSENVKLLKVIPCTLLKEERKSEVAANKIILSVVELVSLNKRLAVK